MGLIDDRVRSEGLFTFDAVQERLVEAMILWRRAPDRESGWLHVKAYWPEINRHTFFGDYADVDAYPRPLPLTRAQVAEMTEAGEWLAMVPERDRRLVVLGLAALASGRPSIPWLALRKPMGLKLGAHGLRKRYTRAIARIAFELNR